MPKTVVHTVDARSNIMLEVVRDNFGVGPRQMHREIQGMLKRAIALLKSKGIAYGQLGPALVPQRDRHEMALIFDTYSMTESWYGLPIHTRLLPLLARESSRSILVGDYIGENHQQEQLYQYLVEGLVPARDMTFRHSGLLYIVYLNNLTRNMMENLHAGFKAYPHYSGFVDTTYASGFKWYLSTILVNGYIQHRDIILFGHEDDRPDSEDINMPGYPFEEHGFTVRSVPGTLQGVLLSYKIERPVFPGFESDTEFSLNAVHPEPMPIGEFEIVVDERKFEYLAREKAESLRGLGLLGADPEALKEMITKKILASYIYNMVYNDEHNITQFNIILELPKPSGKAFRVLVGLKYRPDLKQLQVVTLY